MARTRTFPGYVCPSCGVLVLSDAAVVELPGKDEPVCVICAPYDPEDPEREGIAIMLLHDAMEEMLRRHAMGAVRPEPVRIPFTTVTFYPAEFAKAIAANEFIEELLDVYYEDAPAKSARARARDASKEVIRRVIEMIERHADDPRRVGPVIIPKELTDQYVGILQVLHDMYVSVHRRYVESQPDPEEARMRSYDVFWHIGALIRTGRLAQRPSPWVTGEERPRF